ncbi:hypothetical protein [Streptomyces sp. NPDC056227]|uniref:hypothetical protein n=1 Tax=Streptomyces sp. NPDC056227 TaxID=3345753 RepID=UPI0035D9C20F
MTDRIPLGDLTADALDALYDRLAELEKDAATTAEIMEKADADLDGIIETGRYFRHLAEHQRLWGEQHRDRANRYRARTDAVKAELHALNSETRGLNPIALAGRRDAVARIRAALATITHETQVPDDPRVTELEAENARLRTAWTSARARVKRAKRNRDRELRWANNMWSDALNDLHRYRQAWKSARHRAAKKAEAVERVRKLHQRWDTDPVSCAHCDDGYGTPLRYPCPTLRALDQQQPTARCDYQATTGHEITCTAGFTDVCTCTSAGE